jgi:hypothetical protein
LPCKPINTPLFEKYLPQIFRLIFGSIKGGDELSAMIRAKSRFWQDAVLLTPTDKTLSHPEGELFFEAFDG